jgi:hypothetical protein
MHEMKRQGGVADNPVALASLTDLVLSLVLRGVPHNYLERLGDGRVGAVPAYVRRAEDFMLANAPVPIRMEQVAAAVGCRRQCYASLALAGFRTASDPLRTYAADDNCGSRCPRPWENAPPAHAG